MGRHKILLVDDNQELLRLLARLVEAEGWTAVSCSKGRQALDAIAAEAPAVAVVDVLLPDMMGYEVAAALKEAGVPFLFITGIFKGGRAASEARVQHGAAGYFEKPFEARRLLDTIRGLLPPEPPRRPEPPAKDEAAEDFDVDVAVDAEEPVDAFELTGKVEVTESGRVSAVIRGASLQAGAVTPRPAAAPPAPPSPPATPRTEPPGEGELADNLPELVTAFWLAQQTGELAVSRGKVKKAIYFEKGRPCYAISNLVADRFAPFLVRVGKITQAQLDEVEAAAAKTGRKPGDVLVEKGLLQEAEKIYFVGQQLKAIAYSLFAWEEGRYRLHFTDRAALQPTKVDLHPAHLISRGVKKLYRPDRLERLLAGGDRLMPTQQPAYGLHEVELEDWEASLLPKVDGTRTVDELVALAGKPRAVALASLWALVALEILAKRD